MQADSVTFRILTDIFLKKEVSDGDQKKLRDIGMEIGLI